MLSGLDTCELFQNPMSQDLISYPVRLKYIGPDTFSHSPLFLFPQYIWHSSILHVSVGDNFRTFYLMISLARNVTVTQRCQPA